MSVIITTLSLVINWLELCSLIRYVRRDSNTTERWSNNHSKYNLELSENVKASYTSFPTTSKFIDVAVFPLWCDTSVLTLREVH